MARLVQPKRKAYHQKKSTSSRLPSPRASSPPEDQNSPPPPQMNTAAPSPISEEQQHQPATHRSPHSLQHLQARQGGVVKRRTARDTQASAEQGPPRSLLLPTAISNESESPELSLMKMQLRTLLGRVPSIPIFGINQKPNPDVAAPNADFFDLSQHLDGISQPNLVPCTDPKQYLLDLSTQMKWCADVCSMLAEKVESCKISGDANE